VNIFVANENVRYTVDWQRRFRFREVSIVPAISGG